MQLNDVIKNMGVKHVSFDFWNTLAKGNAFFAWERAEYFSALCARYGVIKTFDEVRAIYSNVKSHFDKMAETTGRSTPTNSVIMYMLDMLDIKLTFKSREVLSHIVQADLEDIFIKKAPIILDDTKSLLRLIFDDGYSLSVTSNTNFISGRTISRIIHKNFTQNMSWKILLFSDLNVYSKPHPNFFNTMAHHANHARKEILHIGDDIICDGQASEYGFKTLLVENPAHLIQTLTE